MTQIYGKQTSNMMDTPLAVKSVFTPYVNDNNYKFTGLGTIFVQSFADGSLVTYNENSVTPVGSVALVGNVEQELTLAYNQAMFGKIQQTLIDDTPISGLAKKWAVQQVADVFVPAHDKYSLAKLIAARPSGNIQATVPASWAGSTEKLAQTFGLAVNIVKNHGGDPNQVVAWVTNSFSAYLAAQINFTGSDAGYGDARNKSYLGKFKGATIVEVPDTYFVAGIYGVVADIRAIVAVTPKLDPKGNGYKVVTEISGFSGVEVQLRDRGDTFVLNRKVDAIATIEEAASTTTTTTTTTAAATTTTTTTTTST